MTQTSTRPAPDSAPGSWLAPAILSVSAALLAPFAVRAEPQTVTVTSFHPDPSVENEKFGQDVDVDGATAVIGAPRTASTATHGTAQVWTGGGSSWAFKETLEPFPLPGAWDSFGSAVAISDDIIVVGAEADGSIPKNAGAVYFFERSNTFPTFWFQRQSYIHDVGGEFVGRTVATDGETAVVGGKGVFLIFERDEGGTDNWGLVAIRRLPASDFFGYSVAVAGPWVAVSASAYDPPETGDSSFNSGVVYLHHRNQDGPGLWGVVEALEPDTPVLNGHFGRQISLTLDDSALISTYRLAVVTNDQSISTYYTPPLGAEWIFDATIDLAGGTDPDPWEVALEGNLLLASRNPFSAKEVYLLRRDTDAWVEEMRLLPGGESTTTFGESIALDAAGSMLIGAPLITVDGVLFAGHVFAGLRSIFVDGFESGDTTVWSSTTP